MAPPSVEHGSHARAGIGLIWICRFAQETGRVRKFHAQRQSQQRLRGQVRAFGAMEADRAVVLDGTALGALADALARSGRMDAAERALARATSLAEAAGAPARLRKSREERYKCQQGQGYGSSKQAGGCPGTRLARAGCMTQHREEQHGLGA